MEKELVFGKRLKNLRLSRGLSQQALATELDLKQNTVSQYEQGKFYPDFKKLGEIASFFKVTVDSLLFEMHDELEGVKEEHEELFLDLKQGMPMEELARKHKIYVDGVELPYENTKRILEQIEFEYSKAKRSK